MARDFSAAGAIFLSLFALPFIGLGLFFAFAFAFSNQTQNDGSALFGSAFGLLFAVIGFGLIGAAIHGYRVSKRQHKLTATYPDSPWMWREDWSAGRASGRPGAASIGAWIAAIFVDVIVAGLVVAMTKTGFKGPAPVVVVLFGAIALFVTFFAIKQTIRRERFGSTWFEFSPGSFVPGAKLRGTIHLKLGAETPHGIDLKLSCVRRIVTGSGKSRTVNEEVLWSDQRNVDSSNVQRMMNDEGLLPVEFMIPADAYESNDDDPNDQVIWKLHASADVVGVDFDDEYVIPVYRNAAIPQEQSMAAAASATGATFAGVLPKDVTSPPSTQVELKQDERGTVFEFGAFRNPKQTLFLLLFAIVWGGVVYLLFTKAAGGPILIFRVFFGLSMVLIIYGLLSSLFGKSEITVGENSVTVRNSLLGIVRTKKFSFTDVSRVAVLDNAQTGAVGGSNCGVQFALASGEKVNVAASTLSRQEAVWVASVVEQAMGRNDRIGVEFNPAMAASHRGAPPQSRAGFPRPVPTRTTKAAQFVPIIFFVFFAGLMFYRFQNVMSSAPRSTPVRAAAADPLTDADISRLGQASPQQFAEELLERSIRHEDRARELLMSRIGEMSSKVKMTASMAKLEERSRYSTDLRVRQANAAVNIAIAGLQVQDGAAEAMLDNARNDPSQRSSLVYYAGMVGSEESSHERIVERLKDFALNDPDEKVRLWAVEGLRFTNSEDALEVEWQAFTNDASMSVRDRAGCNVSDCGIFERRMRWKYVPKLIELLADPQQNSQMHSWAAMALSEITDAKVPSTRQAWADWYATNGTKKTAEFDSIPWYQVRGDQ